MNVIKIVVSGLALLIAFGIGVAWGNKQGRFQAGLEENKLATIALKASDLNLSPEFREYLKGRIYFNIASKFPNDRGYLLRSDWDFGPVDSTLLERSIYVKDLYACDSFDQATSHLSEAEPDSNAGGIPAALID